MKNIQNKTVVAIALVVCLASTMVLSQQASAEPIGYKSTQKVNTSVDFVYQTNIWSDKATQAAMALDQLTAMHASVHKITGCFNGQICMHSLIVNSRS